MGISGYSLLGLYNVRKEKKNQQKTIWFYIALHSKSFSHRVNICAGKKVPRWGKRRIFKKAR